MAVWDADLRWTPAQVGAALDAHDAAAAPHRVTPVAEGFDCAVFEVEGGDYVRVPRREVALGDLAVEGRALPLLAPRLPLAIPTPVSSGAMLDAPGWPWLRYRPVPGRELAEVDPASVDQRPLAEALGRFLARLHAPETLNLAAELVPGDEWRRGDMPWRVPKTLGVLDRLAGLDQGAGLPFDRLRALVAPAEGVGATSDALVHGDLHARHVMLGSGNVISGIIDWGDLHRGERAVDLRVLYSLLDPPARPVFESAYGRRLDERERAIARVIAVYIDAVLLESAADFARAGLVEATRAGLERASRD